MIDWRSRVAAGELPRMLAPRHQASQLRVPTSPAMLAERWESLAAPDAVRAELLDETSRDRAARYARNVENYVGTVKVPVGVAGPLRVNGVHARGDFLVPLATTEAALVASYSRGAGLITAAGGCAAMLVREGVTRAPGFAFATVADAARFVAWVGASVDELRRVAEATTRHGRLADVRPSLEGNHVYLILDFHTGDAAGQNMATIAAQAVCDHIVEAAPVRPRRHYVEANRSGDKKASMQAFLAGRGRSATCEAVLPAALVERHLHATPEAIAAYWRMSAVGGVMSGTIGVQGHYANGLAALFLACGQDVACVAESAVGVTRLELTEGGALYAAVTLPSLVVGTVGGGTGLPSQCACLELLGLAGEGRANAFAELCAALSLAGELSIVGALVAGEFTSAHARLARGRTPEPTHAG